MDSRPRSPLPGPTTAPNVRPASGPNNLQKNDDQNSTGESAPSKPLSAAKISNNNKNYDGNSSGEARHQQLRGNKFDGELARGSQARKGDDQKSTGAPRPSNITTAAPAKTTKSNQFDGGANSSGARGRLTLTEPAAAAKTTKGSQFDGGAKSSGARGRLTLTEPAAAAKTTKGNQFDGGAKSSGARENEHQKPTGRLKLTEPAAASKATKGNKVLRNRTKKKLEKESK